jgi:FtsP/CotA-like multicopper oxidase with cupredoxin domain
MTSSIDQHPLWVYAVDGRYIELTEVDAITVFTGSSYSVLVDLNKLSGNYAMRAVHAGIQIMNVTAVLSYASEIASSKPATQNRIINTSDNPYVDITRANTSASVIF